MVTLRHSGTRLRVGRDGLQVEGQAGSGAGPLKGMSVLILRSHPGRGTAVRQVAPTTARLASSAYLSPMKDEKVG